MSIPNEHPPGPSPLEEDDDLILISHVGPHALGTVRLSEAGQKAVAQQTKYPMDLAEAVPRLFRLLDLVTEQGSSGLTEKFIVDQNGLEKLFGLVRPGAYSSMTRIDFQDLNNLSVKPLGVYGSKDEIIKFLVKHDVITPEMASILRNPTPDCDLRSGLYVVTPDSKAPANQWHIVYWPEETTWNDNAFTTVKRNRVTFMRYLTKSCDQIICLISSKHANGISWEDSPATERAKAAPSRLYTFKVQQTVEQEEAVNVHPGFDIPLPSFACDRDDAPKRQLIHGETCQGFLTPTYIPEQASNQVKCVPLDNWFQKEEFLKIAVILDPDLSRDDTSQLIESVFKSRYPEACAKWEDRKDSSRRTYEQTEASHRSEYLNALEQSAAAFRAVFRDIVQSLYPGMTDLGLHEGQPISSITQNDYVAQIPFGLDKIQSRASEISNRSFRALKEHITVAKILVSSLADLNLTQEHVQGQFWTIPKFEQQLKTLTPEKSSWGLGKVVRVLKFAAGYSSQAEVPLNTRALLDKARSQLAVSDPLFMSSIASEATDCPEIEEATRNAVQTAQNYLSELREQLWQDHCVLQERAFTSNSRQRAEAIRRNEDRESLEMLNNELVPLELRDSGSLRHCAVITAVESGKRHTLKAKVQTKTLDLPQWEYALSILGLRTDDIQRMAMQPSHIPSPRISLNLTFRLPAHMRLIYTHFLYEYNCCIFIVDDQETIAICLRRTTDLGLAYGTPGAAVLHKHLPRSNLINGDSLLVSFDETTRILAFCSGTQLNAFRFDESYQRCISLDGGPFDLSSSADVAVAVEHVVLLARKEEVAFVGADRRVRLYSLALAQMRSISFVLDKTPTSMCCTPDGTCLLFEFEAAHTVVAYHLASLFTGTVVAHSVVLPGTFIQPIRATSFGDSRRPIHAMALTTDGHIQSVYLDIRTRSTEYQFRQTNAQSRSPIPVLESHHNCLVDVHSDMWTRFPVSTPVERRHVSGTSSAKGVIFVVATGDRKDIARHFQKLLRTFEATSKKSIEPLQSMEATTLSWSSFLSSSNMTRVWGRVSLFHLGDWIMHVLCLIPIQIAITQNGQFLPLKDGVNTEELHRHLLGADLGRIIDHLSLGWYESIFQSYLSEQPVRVVSSMGAQSVGKSYCLNHLTDASFAGSAMRTTEGVWLSVTPTQECLVVSLDFEGVDSIERSQQEDMLLVLFNTAISNMVLFRNNFSISRDINNLFRSFQSSSGVLDRKANPGLFQSSLVIIIKDVLESDSAGIRDEFGLKFQKLVQDEQGGNFISHLHSGDVNIIPWPLLQSSDYYTYFSELHGLLSSQPVTHTAAGEFLLTIKSLMAKIMTNDWGALSETLVAHRAQRLLDTLEMALAFGVAETNPVVVPLKNLDTDKVLCPVEEPAARFFMSQIDTTSNFTKDSVLTKLFKTWPLFPQRNQMDEVEWVTGLTKHLHILVRQRIDLVQEWIASNMERFQAQHPNVDTLSRQFQYLVVDLKAHSEPCRSKCSQCHLLCLRAKTHEVEEPHLCGTNHLCTNLCDYQDEPNDQKACGLPAGHSDKHLCAVGAHLCGHQCDLFDKRGCMGQCTKEIDHESDGHVCSARVHACGEPCPLKNIDMGPGNTYSCTGTCIVASHTEHSAHECETSQCPLKCQLCQRQCASSDHLHALQPDTIHLCGEEHSCMHECESAGICQVENTPRSVSASFNGRYSTFQYTLYTQAARRLTCRITIPSGQLQHLGRHCHTREQDAFHFCHVRCKQCGYYCTLPLGHSQELHETSHGSMANTKWSIIGESEDAIELAGRRFAAGEEGSPMMCNILCKEMGRHTHVAPCDSPSLCRPENQANGRQHIAARVAPDPNIPKDLISHKLCWEKLGFKDPYSREEQVEFALCDVQCPGPEHDDPTRTSKCRLPLFHSLARQDQSQSTGYISTDGHSFSCDNPVKGFHIIILVDRSYSMDDTDRLPDETLAKGPEISARANNRLGVVFSALYSFWSSRQATQMISRATTLRDAYSIIAFNHTTQQVAINDTSSTPSELLDKLLELPASGGTTFDTAISEATAVMEAHWDDLRLPVVLFLSDGEDTMTSRLLETLCHSASTKGAGLSLQTIAFGTENAVLQHMAAIAAQAQRRLPAHSQGTISSYNTALDLVNLENVFLNIADSLRKTRGALYHR